MSVSGGGIAQMSGVDEALGQAVEDIGAYIRRQRESAQVSLRQLAKTAGVSNPYLSQIERGLRKPSAEILSQIATGLRISAEALYVRAGILEAKAGSPVLDALAADTDITERQKQVLADIYESFRRENAGQAPTGPASTATPSTTPSATPGTSAVTGVDDEPTPAPPSATSS